MVLPFDNDDNASNVCVCVCAPTVQLASFRSCYSCSRASGCSIGFTGLPTIVQTSAQDGVSVSVSIAVCSSLVVVHDLFPAPSNGKHRNSARLLGYGIVVVNEPVVAATLHCTKLHYSAPERQSATAWLLVGKSHLASSVKEETHETCFDERVSGMSSSSFINNVCLSTRSAAVCLSGPWFAMRSSAATTLDLNHSTKYS